MPETEPLYQYLTEKMPGRSYGASDMNGLHSTKDNIEIRNHNLQEVVDKLFSDEGFLTTWSLRRSFADKLKRKFVTYPYTYFNYGHGEEVELTTPPVKVNEFFGQPDILLDIGCGPGQAPFEAASKLPHLQVIGIDYELSQQIFPPAHELPNLAYLRADWNRLPVADASIDRIMSTSAAFMYGYSKSISPEIDRISKRGTMLRAQYLPRLNNSLNKNDDDLIKGNGTAFAYELSQLGWDIWIDGFILIGQKK